MKIDNYIRQYRNVFSKEEVDLILTERINTSLKNGVLTDLLVRRDTQDEKWIKIHELIESKITSIVHEYLLSYCRLFPLEHLSVSHIGFLNDHSGSFTETHYDSEMVVFNGEAIVKPLIVLIYLNDGYDGGELMFPLQGFQTTPEIGSIVVFPSGFAFPHLSIPVIDGSKHLCRITYKVSNDFYKVAVMEI